VAVARKKTTVYLDPELIRAAKMRAARTGQQDYEVFEAALREYLAPVGREAARQALRGLLDRASQREGPSDEESLRLAYSELRAVRRERHLAMALDEWSAHVLVVCAFERGIGPLAG
jgi:hypothetical protein